MTKHTMKNDENTDEQIIGKCWKWWENDGKHMKQTRWTNIQKIWNNHENDGKTRKNYEHALETYEKLRKHDEKQRTHMKTMMETWWKQKYENKMKHNRWTHYENMMNKWRTTWWTNSEKMMNALMTK